MNSYKDIFCCSLLMAYAVQATASFMGVGTDWFLSFLLTIFDCFLIGAIAYGLGKMRLAWLAWIPTIAATISELFCIFFYQSLFDTSVMQLILETNAKESSEFLYTALQTSDTWWTLGITAVAIVLGLGVSRAFDKWKDIRWRRIAILPTILFALIAWSGVRQMSSYTKLAKCFYHESIAYCSAEVNIPHLNTPLNRMGFGLAFNKATSAELNKLADSVERIGVDSCSYRSPLIVLIIGESHNKHHSSLYKNGYLNTNPRLSKRREAGNLVVYDDAVSPFNMTSHVFKYMFSTWDEECSDDWTAHSLFPAIFRKAGYDVHFVTNQFVIDTKDQWNVMGGTIFNDKRLSDAQFTTRNTSSYAYDGELLRDIPDAARLRSTSTLLIVHLYGQHVDYKERYPKQYAKFTAKEENTPFGGDMGKEIAAYYDNATLYNDAIVDSVMKIVDNEDAICIYLADHGEEAYDWRDKYERTHDTHPIPKEVLRYQYEIPLMFYMTDKYVEQHPDIAEQVRTSHNRRFISTDLCHTLFYLAGIKTKEYQERKCILSPNYDNNRKRIIKYETNYDKTMAQ